MLDCFRMALSPYGMFKVIFTSCYFALNYYITPFERRIHNRYEEIKKIVLEIIDARITNRNEDE